MPNILNSHRDSGWKLDLRFNVLAMVTIVPCVFCVATSTLGQTKESGGAEDPNLVAGKHVESILGTSAMWKPMLQGEGLQGWTGDLKGYTVDDGVLICKKGGKNLVSEKEYSDFAFQFEFKLEESGNNGIGIRVPAGGHPASSGMEIQILDHNGARYSGMAEMSGGTKRKLSWLKPWQYHGSIYGVTPARTGYLKPVGQWNQETIIAIDDHVIVILNGAVIVDASLDDTVPVDGGDHPGMKNSSGHLVLAGHNDRVEFRNMKIADYSVSPATHVSHQDNVPPDGFTPLFNGKDLQGWKGLAHKNANSRRELKGDAATQAQESADEVMRDHWSVIDGVLTYDGEGQSLCTDKDYGDFEMYIDWKIPAGADSGIYLRGTPQIQIWDPWDLRMKAKENGAVDGASDLTEEQWVAAYKNGRNLGSGGLWNNKRWRNSPTVLADKKPGEWNRFLIRMVGDKVTIWLNGKKIVDRVVLENYWDKSGVVPLPRADQIELQHHGSALYFKNLYIRELPY